jgi:hypothetical protein
MEHPNKTIDHIIDNSKKRVVKSLVPQEVIEAATRVFNGQAEMWLSVHYVYDQLCRHPKRFGFESAQQLPLRRDFEATCRSGAFRIDQVGKQVLIRPYKGESR